MVMFITKLKNVGKIQKFKKKNKIGNCTHYERGTNL